MRKRHREQRVESAPSPSDARVPRRRACRRARAPRWPRDDGRRRCRAPESAPNAATSASRSAPPTRHSVWLHAVGRREIDRAARRRSPRAAIAIDVGDGAIGEEHRTGLRAERQHVPRAVVFLVAPRALVLLDDVAVVFVDRIAGGQAGLLVAAHLQPIEVHARLVFERRALSFCSAAKLSAARS